MQQLLELLKLYNKQNYSPLPEYASKLARSMSPQYPGLLEHGNIDLYNRPKVLDPKGGYNTVYTMTAGIDNGRVVLLPRIINGKMVSPDEAIKHFRKTNEHMGIFDSEDAANLYDEAIHNQMGWIGPENKW